MPDSRTPKKMRARTSKRRSGQHLTKRERTETQALFLASFAEHANVRLACDKARIARATVYEWREQDAVFAAAWAEAEADANDRLTKEIERRAVTGWLDPVYQGGAKVGTIRKFSDTLLIFLKKARDPAFRDRAQMELTGKDGGPVQVEHAAKDALIAKIEEMSHRNQTEQTE